MELPQQLPPELWFNVIKFSRHPVAEVFMSEVFPSVVPRDMSNNGLKREPYKIYWKKRGYKYIHNAAFCDQPKHKNSSLDCLFSDEEDD